MWGRGEKREREVPPLSPSFPLSFRCLPRGFAKWLLVAFSLVCAWKKRKEAMEALLEPRNFLHLPKK